MSDLAHELQKERGTSAIFVGSDGQHLQDELTRQRHETDTARSAYMAMVEAGDFTRRPDGLGETIRASITQLDQLDARRAAISGLTLKGPASNAYYIAAIAPLIEAIGHVVSQSAEPSVTQALTTFYDLAQAKEAAGQERAVGAVGFVQDKVDAAQYQLFMGIVSAENSYFHSFNAFATQANRDLLARTVAGADVEEVMALRKRLLETPVGESLGNVAADHWFKVATARIDLMKQVEDKIAARMIAIAASVRSAANAAFWAESGVAAMLVGIATAIGAFIARGITRPLLAMTAAMQQLANGNQEVAIPAQGQRDEIGEMAKAVEVFKQQAIENHRLTEATAREQAAKNRRQAAMDRHTRAFGTSISGVMSDLMQSADGMQSAAHDMSGAAVQTRDSTSHAASGANTSSHDLSAVAVATEEMASSISEISRQVTHVTAAVREAVSLTTETNVKVTGLADTAEKIGDIVRLISDIAGQTNLLALNATIEAARAGEAGKGFAVVASEVKALATQTARATEQIGSQITAISFASAEAKHAARAVGSAIERVDEVAAAIAAAVEEQAAATQEISRNVQTVTTATGGVAQAMEQVLTIAERTDSTSRSVLTAADEVRRTADTLRAKVDDFLTAMNSDADGQGHETPARIAA
ncbi:MAG TPA: methyl-accepting chemotaxis protein [Rhodopila sp.]|nr:methyl-accepting chemotaxis protein [Rhodopila sp.]